MTNKIVLDANVFIKLFPDEPDREKAIELVDALGKKEYVILAPTLFPYEVLRVAITERLQAQVHSVHGLISDYRERNLELVEVDDETIREAIDISNTGNEKSGYPDFHDSIYHALAIVNGCPFITADKRHKAKTETLGNIVLLGDWEEVVL
uniref:Ribonuclease VapC n=1 Tax=Candidatus Kentrum eta TaxID=2126337 RepID=A0A450UJE6_9GAMM|nr:MAG: Predicted nucleic acid-binding protein, contains PIN domain [Candidatus Kentron sp. H]VFJ92679.1 MAG: Predicted nucleic acid-binding protein, contains PIN domain [Candidatus Kentron sp. H]VFJ99476.1 MAG: Predicted nucleic acid-binding protein, contains PIN domain [Candidatus Kentron sp. H]